MGWYKKLKKKVKKVVKDPIGALEDDLRKAEEEAKKLRDAAAEDVNIEDLISEDPTKVFDALNDVGGFAGEEAIKKGVEIADEGGGDFADVLGEFEDIKEDNPDLSIGDLLNPEVGVGLTDDIFKASIDTNENIIDATGNTKENFQKIFGDELGAYFYETQPTGGLLQPSSEEDFQNFGNEELFGPDGDIAFVNEEIDKALGGSGEATKEAAQTQIDFSRKALGLLRDDLAPYKDILSDKQISDLGNLATRQDAQTAFLDDNALLDKIRGDVTGASFRGDQGESLDILDLAAPSQGGQPTNRRTGGVKGEKSPQEVFNSSGKNTNIPTGASTQDIISKVFLGAGNDLINQQINRQLPMLSTGQNSAAQVATGSSNLLTGAGNAAAAGTIGAANQQAGNTQNLIGLIATLFSDERLKTNIVKTGEHNGLNVYQWDWNDKGAELGLYGPGTGHIAQEVQLVYPKLVSTSPEGYLMVNYSTDRTVN